LDICGGIIGARKNKKFCAAHPSVCDHPLMHGKRKLNLAPNTVYVMSAKQGGMHATLLPTLLGNCVPEDKEIGNLLDDDPLLCDMAILMAATLQKNLQARTN
jgi:hypothetical protein